MNCFATLSDVHAMSRGQASHLEAVVRHLFETFDADGNGVIDLAELSSGLSVLCGGSRDDKVRAAFSLYDSNGDGFISLAEMIRQGKVHGISLTGANLEEDRKCGSSPL